MIESPKRQKDAATEQNKHNKNRIERRVLIDDSYYIYVFHRKREVHEVTYTSRHYSKNKDEEKGRLKSPESSPEKGAKGRLAEEEVDLLF